MISILARKSILIVLNNLIGGVLGFITLSIVARTLGADDLGVLGFGLSFLGMFTFISNLGFDAAHNKRVSEGQDLGQCMGAYVYFKSILTLLMAIVSLAVIQVYSRFFDGFSSTKEELVVYVFLAYYILWSLSLIPITTFNSERKQAKAQLPSILEFLVRTPLIVGLVLAGYGIVFVAISYVVGAFVLLGLGVVFLKGYPIKKPDKWILRSYARFATPMAIIAVNATLYLHIDKVMIGIFWDPTEVGFYYGAQRIIMFIVTSSAAVAILLFPTISSLHSKGNIKEINIIIKEAERYLSMLIFPITALTIALRESIVELILGDGFDEAEIILAFLALYALLNILNRPYSQILMATGKTRIAVLISTGIFLVNVMLNLVFIPEELVGISLLGLGGLGAAIATFIADTGRFVLFRKEARKIIGDTFQVTIIGKHLIASAISGSLIFWTSSHFSDEFNLYLLIPLLILGIGIYLLILVLMHEFKRKDLDFFIDMVHPKKMGGYIISEIQEKAEKGNNVNDYQKNGSGEKNN